VPMQQEEHDALRANAANYLESVAQRLRARGSSVDTTVVIQPQCAVGILEQAATAEANLIAMATHGRSGLQRLALGSVADKVMRGTSVPLLLLRPEGTELELSASA
jgi:nucleotide-binding universal stress UspA family protein